MAETAVAQVGAGVAIATFVLTVAIGRWLMLRRLMVDRIQRFVGIYVPAGTRSRDIDNQAPLTSRAARLRAFVAARRTHLLLGIAILVLLLASKIMLGWVLAGLLALGSLVAWGWRRQRQRARTDQIEPQLVAALRLMSSSLECGLSAVQALDRMQAESPSPIAEEFAQVTRALELGTPLHLALEEVAMRVGSASFASFAMIVSVQHRIGGDMAALLNTLADNIQERLEFKAQLNALTAQARYSAWVLTALPFGVCGLVALANPAYISPLVLTTVGRIMLGFAALLLLIGLLAVRTISRVDL